MSINHPIPLEVLAHHRSVARRKWKDDELACFLVCGGDLVRKRERHSRFDTFSRLLWLGERVMRVLVDTVSWMHGRRWSTSCREFLKFRLASFGFTVSIPCRKLQILVIVSRKIICQSQYPCMFLRSSKYYLGNQVVSVETVRTTHLWKRESMWNCHVVPHPS